MTNCRACKIRPLANEYVTSSSYYEDDDSGYAMRTNQEAKRFNEISNAYGLIHTVTEVLDRSEIGQWKKKREGVIVLTSVR